MECCLSVSFPIDNNSLNLKTSKLSQSRIGIFNPTLERQTFTSRKSRFENQSTWTKMNCDGSLTQSVSVIVTNWNWTLFAGQGVLWHRRISNIIIKHIIENCSAAHFFHSFIHWIENVIAIAALLWGAIIKWKEFRKTTIENENKTLYAANVISSVHAFEWCFEHIYTNKTHTHTHL